MVASLAEYSNSRVDHKLQILHMSSLLMAAKLSFLAWSWRGSGNNSYLSENVLADKLEHLCDRRPRRKHMLGSIELVACLVDLLTVMLKDSGHPLLDTAAMMLWAVADSLRVVRCIQSASS